MRRSIAFAALFLLCLIALPSPRAISQPLPSDPRVLRGECENGLKYIVTKHTLPPGKCLVWLHVGSGSLNETDKQRGASHLISHLAFDGSANFPADAMPAFLDAIGMRPTPDLNASTNFEESVYRLSLKDNTPEVLTKALAFLGDIAQGKLSFPGAEFEKERTAVLAEQKATLTLDQRIQDYLWGHISPGSTLGDRLKLGTPDSVAGITLDEVKAYYAKWYVPSNMTVMVVGDIDPAATVTQITSKMGAGKKVPAPKSLPTGVKPYTQSSALVISDSELPQAQVYIFRVENPATGLSTEDDLRAKVLDSLAIGAFNRRLAAKAEAGAKFQNASAFSFDLANACQLVGVNAPADAKAWREPFAALCAELQRAREHGLYKHEIDDTRKQFISQSEMNVRNEQMRQAAGVISGLNAAVGNGDSILSAQQTVDLLKKLLEPLDQKTVSDHFKKLFDPSAVMFVLAVPTAGDVPKEPELLKLGTDSMATVPPAEAEEVRPDSLMATKPTPAKIVDQSDHTGTNVWTGWFENNAVMHYKFMDTKKGQVTFTVALAGGVILEDDATRGLSEAASIAFSRPATSTFSSAVIRDVTKDKKIKIGGGPGLDGLVLGVSGEATDVEAGLQLLHLLFTDPVIEPAGFDTWKKTQLEQAEARLTQPREVFNDAMLSTMFPKNEWRPRPMTKDQLDKVTLPAATEWLKKEITTSPIEVSVVGDISKEKAVELVGAYIGTLAKRDRISGSTYADRRVITRPKGPNTATRELAGTTDSTFVMAGYYGADADNMTDTRLVGLASQILTARLTSILQNQEHLVIQAQVLSQPAQEFPGFGIFGAFAPTEPANADAAAKRIFDIFQAFASGGPTPEELAVAKATVTAELEKAIAEPGFWSGQLSMQLYHKINLQDLVMPQAAYEKIQPADVRDGAAKYIKDDAKIQLILNQRAPGPIAPATGPTPAK